MLAESVHLPPLADYALTSLPFFRGEESGAPEFKMRHVGTTIEVRDLQEVENIETLGKQAHTLIQKSNQQYTSNP
jgi:hypothetical protein